MIRSADITYEPINGNDLVNRVIIKGKITGYVHFNKESGQWIYLHLDNGKHTRGLTRTIAVGKSILNNTEKGHE